MKKIIISIVSLVLVFGMISFADEIVDLLNFEGLGTKAISGSLSLDSAKLTLESKELELVDVLDDAESNNYAGGNRVEYINRMIIVLSDPIMANMDVELSKKALKRAEVTIKSDTYLKGMKFLLLQKELELNERLLEFKNSYKEFTNQKLINGVSTGSELTNKIIDVQTQELKLLELNASLESVKIDLNHLLGETLDADINIDDTITLSLFSEIGLQALYNKRVDAYPAVYEKAEMLKSKEVIFGLYEDKYIKEAKEYKAALYNKQIAEIELTDAKKSYELSLRSAYNNLLNKHDAYLLSVKQNELSNKLYANAILKYDLGVINLEELLNAEEAKLNSDFSLVTSIYNYNVAKVEFDNLY